VARGDVFWSDAVTVHQRPDRPDLVGACQSHLPLEQLIDRLSFREVEFLDLLFVGAIALATSFSQGSAATRSLILVISALRVEFSAFGALSASSIASRKVSRRSVPPLLWPARPDHCLGNLDMRLPRPARGALPWGPAIR
jgi:hypothetical protein